MLIRSSESGVKCVDPFERPVGRRHLRSIIQTSGRPVDTPTCHRLLDLDRRGAFGLGRHARCDLQPGPYALGPDVGGGVEFVAAIQCPGAHHRDAGPRAVGVVDARVANAAHALRRSRPRNNAGDGQGWWRGHKRAAPPSFQCKAAISLATFGTPRPVTMS